ncbi:ABC transporter ATP-binding protein [Streptomyces sp. TRM66268-LWL]|uniref:ABC transporter ATP-binding protein n=1 Tax=Streptomyces polyasparticus TaxID=2767826 RepID=A0ABR7SJP4_9ACTN|nr:ABC transporter ATP-binding protein [Streptomyces polyasparticus]MBC9714701.1 ABC transporter ATP-binding protein [Streptomyces polyasparticus]
MKIQVRGLTKAFGGRRVVDGLTFEVEPAAVTGFLGPNGAGKTTTLRMLLGLVAPDSGSATVDGRPYAELPDPGRTIGAALEATGFHPARTGRDHLAVLCTVHGFDRRRADEALETVGLAEAARRRVGGYSQGMRQRLALAAALLGDPEVLVLDEPSNGLDPEGIAWLRQFLRTWADAGRTVLVSSHLLSEMEQLVDRVVIIDRGRLVHAGPLAHLPGGQVSVHSPQAEALRTALEATGARTHRTRPDALTVTGLPCAEIGRLAHRHRIELHELTPESGDLETLFFTLTGGGSGSGSGTGNGIGIGAGSREGK